MYRRYGKRILDIALSGLALAILSPLMLAVAVSIRLTDRGPALFRQQRVGRHGQPFTILKFRSMRVDTRDVPSTEAPAVNITKVGRVIRRTNLDELPQLINIFRGDMSLVGPRPALARQRELCLMREQSGAMSCLPGLTGLAQVNSYDGMSDAEKAAWDAKYHNSVTLLGDIQILLRTVAYLRKPPPVY